ncbi:MAG: HlyD family secretion protein [Rhodospirillales bacterium]
MSKSRLLRIGVSAVVLIGALVILLPRLFSEIRSNGTINARVITLQAPISGTIHRTGIEVGERVKEGDVLSRITDDTESQGLLANFTIDRDLLTIRSAALVQRLAEVETIKTDLETRVERYARETVENLKLRREEAIARQNFWDAVAEERAATLKRQQTLMQSGSSTPARADEAKSLALQAREEVARARADAKRLTQEFEAASAGVFVHEGQNDVPYSRQKLDEVTLTLSDLRLQLAETEGRLAALNVQLGEEGARVARRETASISSPIDGIVWRRLVANNSTVTKNNDLSKILDCTKLIVEVGITESMAEDIAIGQPVSVRLQGGKRSFHAKVTEIRGTRSVTPGLEYAAQPPALKKDEVLLVAEWADPTIYDTPSNFCNVGRRAEVTIGGKAPANAADAGSSNPGSSN